jgi:hypothetical protein
MRFPSNYGQLMAPFDVTRLPTDVISLYHQDPTVRRWIEIEDQVRRAEKISCWTQWTGEQKAAYDAGDWRLFSRLRGYTEAEIHDFAEMIRLQEMIDLKYGSDFAPLLSHLLWLAHMTDELAEIEAELSRMSDA